MAQVTIETSSLALMELARAAEKRAQENSDANRNDLARELRIAAQELETAALEAGQ